MQLLRASLPENEVIRDALRQEESVYPENALRELIANSLIHQDFTIRGKSPMIEIFDNRIEITNSSLDGYDGRTHGHRYNCCIQFSE